MLLLCYVLHEMLPFQFSPCGLAIETDRESTAYTADY